jgi:hypothetical protein
MPKRRNKGLRVSARKATSFCNLSSMDDAKHRHATYPAAGGEDKGLRRAAEARDAVVAVVDLNAAAFIDDDAEALHRRGRLLGVLDAEGTGLRRAAPRPCPAATGRDVVASMAVKEGREGEFFFGGGGGAKAFPVFLNRPQLLV